jgi:hypothetical protein
MQKDYTTSIDGLSQLFTTAYHFGFIGQKKLHPLVTLSQAH